MAVHVRKHSHSMVCDESTLKALVYNAGEGLLIPQRDVSLIWQFLVSFFAEFWTTENDLLLTSFVYLFWETVLRLHVAPADPLG